MDKVFYSTNLQTFARAHQKFFWQKFPTISEWWESPGATLQRKLWQLRAMGLRSAGGQQQVFALAPTCYQHY